MSDDLPYNIDLTLDLPEDPTELVSENKVFLSELKKCGFDGREIGKILRNYYGLYLSDCSKTKNKKGWIEFDDIVGLRIGNEPWPSKAKLKKYKVEYESFCKSVDYAIRSSKGLINSPFISKKTKDLLREDIDRLSKTKEMGSYKTFKDRPLHPCEIEEKRPKSIVQMIGRQVFEIYNYTWSFREKIRVRRDVGKKTEMKLGRKVTEVEIFSFICEIFNGTEYLKPYTKEYIKDLYYNYYNSI